MALTHDIAPHYPGSAPEAGLYLGSGQVPRKHGLSAFGLMVSALSDNL